MSSILSCSNRSHECSTSMDTSSSVSPSASATSTSSPSPTTSGTGSSSGPNTGAIVGGTVGGVAALVFLAVSLLYYWRHKKRDDGQPSAEEGAVVEPFLPFREVPSTSLVGTTTPTHSVGLSTEVSIPTYLSIRIIKLYISPYHEVKQVFLLFLHNPRSRLPPPRLPHPVRRRPVIMLFFLSRLNC